ncbi:MAG: beta-N-acetylhexosaminidase [Pseudomonadota bacterium]
MTLGPLMVDIEGLELTAEDRQLLSNPVVGGIILFSRNFHSLDQLERLVQEIHQLRSPPLLIAVDQEGGRVQRFKDGFTILPEMQQFGQVYDNNPKLATHLAKECGWLMASEIRTTGIDISFAPVLDLDKGISSVIGGRAFHSDPSVVGLLAKAFISGMNEAGMQATGKHFPGHGSIAADSHIAMPVDDREWQSIEHEDLYPFKYLIDEGIHALMIAHVIYPKVDNQAAGFSSFWLKDVLRQQLCFQGVIFSDDLSMEGAVIAGDYIQRAHKSLEAGCDMILVCNNRVAALQVAESLVTYSSPASAMRLAHLHGTNYLTREQLVKHTRWLQSRKELAKYLEEPSQNLELFL